MNHEYIKKDIKDITKSIIDDVINIRRWIHQHPELSFQEKKTSEYICSVLKEHDISFKNNIGGYGVVAVIKGLDPDSHIIGLRGDMDALPIQEKNDIEYKSKYDGIMHACGHDVHTSIMLGTAIVLNKMQNMLSLKVSEMKTDQKLANNNNTYFLTSLSGNIVFLDLSNLTKNGPIIGQEHMSLKLGTPGLKDFDIDAVFKFGLHDFLQKMISLFGNLSNQIEIDYRFYE